MNSQHQLHIVFLPFMAHGHMIPLVDMARRFARHGAKSTVITTPLNAPTFSNKITRDAQLGLQIQTHIIQFDSVSAGLPKGCENVNSIESPEMLFPFFKSMDTLRAPVHDLLAQWRPDAIVADFVFHWATDTAHGLGIPRLFFNGTGSFAMCLFECLKQNQLHYKNVESESEPFFVVDGVSNRFRFTKMQLPPCLKGEEVESKVIEFRDRIEESEAKSYGVVVNSFRELEAEYAEYYKKVIGRRAWFVGPVSLINKDNNNDGCKFLKWLDSKQPNSVLYICFGSISTMSDAQLFEIAAAIEASGHGFIWVVKKKNEQEWRLPEGFEERTEGRGLVVRGWAPQVMILDHEAIGGFVTHCGWNSTMEGVAAGIPMVTWPIQAEQFLNEKLVTDVLRVGVGVGAPEWSRKERRIVLGREVIGKAVREVMAGEELRIRAMELKEIARWANEEGGSSHCDLKSLLDELRSLKGKMDDGIKQLGKLT